MNIETLTPEQVRAAVAVAEAARERDEAIKESVKRVQEIENRGEFLNIADRQERWKRAHEFAIKSDRAYDALSCVAIGSNRILDKATAEWVRVRPSEVV